MTSSHATRLQSSLVDKLRAVVAQLQQREESALLRMTEANARSGNSQQRLQALQRERALEKQVLISELVSVRAELTRASAERADQAAEIQSLLAASAKWRKEASGVEALSRDVQAYERTNRSLEASFAASESQAQERATKLAAVSDELQGERQHVESLKREVSRLRAELDHLRSTNEELAVEAVVGDQRMQRALESLSLCQRDKQGLKDELTQVEEELRALREETETQAQELQEALDYTRGEAHRHQSAEEEAKVLLEVALAQLLEAQQQSIERDQRISTLRDELEVTRLSADMRLE
jgi:chromosome segregation ATPase